MFKIKELTKEQEELLPIFRDKWIKIGLSTEPANRERAEKAIIESYKIAGLKRPKKIVWCGSPLSQTLTKAIILDRNASVWHSVWWDSIYGQHDAHWLSFYEYFNRVLNLKKQTEKLTGLWQLAKSAGWALPHKNICWISERHNICKQDENNRLHNMAGPAVMYPDGWKIYAVHGVRIPKWIIEKPKLITTDKIEKENNSEIRRIMISKYGQDKYLIDSGAEEISKDQFGTLFRKDIDNDEPLVMVKVKNSTIESDGKAKDYFLRVPPDVKTAREGIAWTFNVPVEEYQPIYET